MHFPLNLVFLSVLNKSVVIFLLYQSTRLKAWMGVRVKLCAFLTSE